MEFCCCSIDQVLIKVRVMDMKSIGGKSSSSLKIRLNNSVQNQAVTQVESKAFHFQHLVSCVVETDNTRLLDELRTFASKRVQLEMHTGNSD